MRLCTVVCVFMLAAIPIQVPAQSSMNGAFFGRWELDLKRSHTTDEMKVERVRANDYTVTFSGADSETIVADGTDQPGAFGTTLSITVGAGPTWKIVRKLNGRMLLSAVWNLSADDQTLTDAFTAYDAKGSPSTVNYSYKRTSGAGGFVGAWENAAQDTNAFELQIEPWGEDGLSFISSADASTRRMRLDGAEYPVTASGAATGYVSSGRRLDPRTLEVTDHLKNTITQTRLISLSADEKSLMMTVHVLGQSKPNILVFERATH